ncbi:hypothetical protein D9_0079 [Aeromonas phage D9]|nr:hypothetical protein D9_0079 [Aeromonas phage D9]
MNDRPNAKQVLAKHTSRTFLCDGDRLSCVSFIHHVTKHVWIKGGERSTYFHDATNLKLFLGGKIIKLHSCDLGSVHYGLVDFVRKLDVIIKAVSNTLDFLGKNPKYGDRFVVKEFLNPVDGNLVDIYTSSIAITSSPTHGLTFELASCDFKSRITLQRKSGPKFLRKFLDFVTKCRNEVQGTLDKHTGTLQES